MVRELVELAGRIAGKMVFLRRISDVSLEGPASCGCNGGCSVVVVASCLSIFGDDCSITLSESAAGFGDVAAGVAVAGVVIGVADSTCPKWTSSKISVIE